MKNKLLKNIFYNYVYEIFLIIVPLITTPYVSRVLGAAAIGTYSYTISLVTYFTTFSVLGLSGYGLREIAFHRKEKELTSRLFFEITIVKTLSVLLFSGGWLVFCHFYSEYTTYMLAVLPLLVACIFDISWFYKGLEKFRLPVLIQLLAKILSTIAIFVFVKTPNDLFLYMLIISISTFAGNVLMWVFLPKNLVKTRICVKHFKTHISQAFIYFLPSLALVIYSVLDKTLIGIITKDAVQNGFYEQAHKIVNLILTLCCGAANGVLNSRLSYMYGTNEDSSTIKMKIADSINFSLTLSVGCMFGLLAIADVFVPAFFGSDFNGSVLLFYIFAPMPLICTYSNCLSSNYYTPSGRKKESAIYYLIASLINLGFNLLFIPILGAVGAAISTIISELFISIVLVARSKHMFSFKDCFKYTYKKMIAGIVMFGVIYLVSYTSKGESIYFVLIKEILIGIVIYFLILFILKDYHFLDLFKKEIKK